MAEAALLPAQAHACFTVNQAGGEATRNRGCSLTLRSCASHCIFMAGQHVISMAVPAPTGSALLLSRAFSSPAIRGTRLITAHGQQAYHYSTSAVVIDGPVTLKMVLTEQLSCSELTGECLLQIRIVKYLQVVTLLFIVSGVGGACYIGQNVMDRWSEVLGQLNKHAPEILGSICNEALFQLKIPFIGSKEKRLVLKDHWFNDPNKKLTRKEKRARRELARQESARLQREEFKRAEEKRRRAAAPLYEQYFARKEFNDMRVQEKLREEKRIHERRMRQLKGEGK